MVTQHVAPGQGTEGVPVPFIGSRPPPNLEDVNDLEQLTGRWSASAGLLAVTFGGSERRVDDR